MSLIRVKDQYGNPPPPSGRLNVQLIPNGESTPQDDRFLDNAGTTSFVGATQLWPNANGAFRLRVNHANVNAAYGQAEVNTANIEEKPIDIVVQMIAAPQPPPPPPGGFTGAYGTCEEWKNATFKLAAKLGFPIISRAALVAMEPELQKLHQSYYVRFQRTSSPAPNDYRERLFLPNSGGQYDRWADFGAFNTPWSTWEHCNG